MNKGKDIKWEQKENGCWNCTSHSTDYGGYPRLSRNGKLENMSRFIYKQFYGELTDDLIIRHKCDNPTCINPEHLEKGTHKDNSNDRNSRNRTARGENHGRAKLTPEQVKKIRSNKVNTLWELASIYNVGYSTVRYAKRGLNWKHI